MITDELCPKCNSIHCEIFDGKLICNACGASFDKTSLVAVDNTIQNFSEAQTLIIALKAASVNLKTLHRNLTGGNWFDTHELIGDYYNKVDEFEDTIVENLISIGINDIALSHGCDRIIEVQKFSEKSALGIIQAMFTELLELSTTVRDNIELPSSVCAAFDEFENWLQIEGRYKLDHYFGEA